MLRLPATGQELRPGWMASLAQEIERVYRVRAGGGIEVNHTDAGQVVSLARSADRVVLAEITRVSGPASAPLYDVAGLDKPGLVFESLSPDLGRPAAEVGPASVGDRCLLIRDINADGPGRWLLCVLTETASGGGGAGEYVRILTSTLISPNRWRYTCVRMVETAGGGYAPSGDSTLYDAFNSMETFNTASGLQGNGVNVDTLPSGFSLRPIAPTVVRADLVSFGGEPEYRFAAPNATDGVCP